MKKQIIVSLMALMILTALMSCGGVLLEPNQLSNGTPFSSDTQWSVGGASYYFNLYFYPDTSYQARLVRFVLGTPPVYAVMNGTYATDKGSLTLTCDSIEDGSGWDGAVGGGVAFLKALEEVPLPLDGESIEFQVNTKDSLGGGTRLILTDSDGTEHVYRGGPLE